ncbi:hypothetical protein LCGC14_0758250, partial [marine sediment metagenome]
MKHLKADPQSIEVPIVRVTAQFEEELYAEFKASIKVTGQITPIICCEVEEKLVLVDGLHRLQEAKNNGDKKIDVVIIPGDMVDVLTKNIFLDHLRGKPPVTQMVNVIKTLYFDHGLDPDKIKEKTGLSRDYIERLIKISEASPSVQEALDQGVIGVGIAFQLSRLDNPIIQDEIIAKHKVWRFNIKDLTQLVDNTLAELGKLKDPPPRAAANEDRPPTVYRCEGCHDDTEPRNLRAVMLCPTCFGVTYRA